MTHLLREELAKKLAFHNDGMENTWQEYLHDADACLETVKEGVSLLLQKKPDVNVRSSLESFLGLSITSAPKHDDLQRPLRPEVSARLSVRRRQVRRRSSASNSVYKV